MSNLSSSRPYLIRGLYDWILDNECTPQILVDASVVGVQVPFDYVSDDQIVLNISPNAVRDFNIDNEGLFFNARFGGVPTDIYVPTQAVLAIYTRETNEGMLFGEEAGGSDPDPSGTDKKPNSEPEKVDDVKTPPEASRPTLTVVK